MDKIFKKKILDKKENLNTGRSGEEIAKDFLKKQGYKIVNQNWKNKYSEIDIVALKDREIIFVEVRTRVGDEFGTPEETINCKKKNKLEFNAKLFMTANKLNAEYRIDAICIVFDEKQNVKRINHYQNITL